MEKVVFEESFLNCIQPKDELEEDILRRAILADGFDDLPGLVSELQPVHRKLLVTGGKLVIDEAWCRDIAVHYELRERLGKSGWYALRVSFWQRHSSEELGGFTLKAALWTFPPLIQAPWLGHKRRFHCHPIWGFPPDGDLRVSGEVRLNKEKLTSEASHLLAVSSVKRYEPWNAVVPHLYLADVSNLTAATPLQETHPPVANRPPAPTAKNLANVPVDAALEEMLEKPQFLADPVFPKESYLQPFAASVFRQVLAQSNKRELIERVRVSNANQQMAMLMAGNLGFWAIDLEVFSERGVTGREEFLSRVSQPIRRPPPEMAAFTAEQHILAKGVAKIQIEDQPPVPGQYEICKLKTIGWYVAALVSPP